MYQRIQTELLITRVQAVSQTCRDAMWFPSWQLDNSPLLTLSSIWGCKIVNLHHCITVSQYIFRLLVSDGWPASTGLFKGCGLKATAETEWNNMTDISQKNSCDPQRGCWCLKKGSRFDAKQSSFIAWTQVLCAKPRYAYTCILEKTQINARLRDFCFLSGFSPHERNCTTLSIFALCAFWSQNYKRILPGNKRKYPGKKRKCPSVKKQMRVF